jgi:hypothetical protein
MLLTRAGAALGAAAGTLQAGEGRNGLVGRERGTRSTAGRVRVGQVRANAGDGAGRSSAQTGLFGRVGSFLSRDNAQQQQQRGAEIGSDMVVYKGTITIMKKLAMLDLMDRGADFQDDASELFQGNRVTVQLISTEVDPSTSNPHRSPRNVALALSL